MSLDNRARPIIKRAKRKTLEEEGDTTNAPETQMESKQKEARILHIVEDTKSNDASE